MIYFWSYQKHSYSTMPDLTCHRYIADDCRQDLGEKLVFIGGPR